MAELSSGVAPTELHQATPERDLRALVVCALAWSAGLIHLQAAADHLSEYVPYAICFVALAILQLAWGAALYRRTSGALVVAGVLVNLGVVAAWALSRTSGLPFGPDLHSPESVGLLDGIATVDELALCMLAVLMLPASVKALAGSRLARRTQGVAQAGAVLMILLSSLVLAGGLHAH